MYCKCVFTVLICTTGYIQAGVLDLAQIVQDYENEILGRAVGFSGRPGIPEKEEESVPATDVGKPEEVHFWDSNLKLGQVSGVAINIFDDPIVFHRGSVSWNKDSFLPNNVLKDQSKGPITANTILTVDQFTGKVKSEMGANLFYMPHGISVDHENNIWVTDVGLHQVMMFPWNSTTPSLVLGEKFVPGSDQNHFCKPTSVVVSKSGNVYIADGYCNKRVVVYDTKGRYQTEIHGDWTVVHSLALFQEEDTLCIADREGRKVDCVGAGINHPQFLGSKILETENLGRVFGIAGRGSALLAVTGPESRRKPDGLTLDLVEAGKVVDNWGKDLQNPHDVAVSREGDTVYVAEIGPNRVRKFEVVAPEDNIFDHEFTA